MMNIYILIDYVPMVCVLIGLIMTWKVESARWFFISYIAVEMFSLAMTDTVMQWNTHFYIYCVFISLVFLLPIVYRKRLAMWLYSKTGYEYFNKVLKTHRFVPQEAGIICVILLAILVNFVTWIEVLLYKYSFLSNAPIKLYVRDNTVVFVKVMICLAMLSYAFRAEFRERFIRDENC
ncbi:hypothetical protein PSECIP111951_00795 [Pseudoalteromonas holothuriae]|uniref:Intracellular septation protein A n=1 Tax=Pseudoalteromonas holothuriae TaxID=2963714 RepID=A0ABM9GFP2_9GAMM|nr:hypothetical protein [Pseudoalteromonas sp. CIP111951]CAH9053307.1 hypothetical protein PSECIP111951_00795 [Pseudoalteromonas sp. CIP111951]